MSRFDNTAQLASSLGYDEDILVEISRNVIKYYKPFHVTTIKNGKSKTRHIDNPHKKLPLRKVQLAIKKHLLEPAIGGLDNSLVGGIKGRKTLGHLLPHIGKQTVICMDLTSCFPNISSYQVGKIWQSLGYSDELSALLTRLTTYRGYLPQGAPTSSLLCNFALNDMAKQIRTYADTQKISYTQYIDDICISGDDKTTRNAMNKIHKITYGHRQKINKSKTEIMDSKHRQMTMGIIINSRMRVNEGYVKKVKQRILEETSQPAIDKTTKLSLMGQVKYVSDKDKEAGAYLTKLLSSRMNQVYDSESKKSNGKISLCHTYSHSSSPRVRCRYCKPSIFINK